MQCIHHKEGTVLYRIIECTEVHIIILMITDTCVGVVINTGINNIEIVILDNSKGQDIDKA